MIAVRGARAVADACEVTLLVTGDEEIGSLTSRALIEEVATGCEAVLVLEPSLDGALKTGAQGRQHLPVAFEGRAAHAGLEPERGRNALIELARLVLWCDSLADTAAGHDGHADLAPGRDRQQRGARARRSSSSTYGRRDRRASSARARRADVHERPAGRRRVRVRVAWRESTGCRSRPRARASLLGVAAGPRPREGLPAPVTASVGGASDANFTAALGVPTLDGLGAVGGGAHADDEWVELSSLDARVRMVAGMHRGPRSSNQHR